TLEQAKAAHDGLLAAESAAVAGLRGRREELEQELAQLEQEPEEDEEVAPAAQARGSSRPPRRPPAERPPEPPPRPVGSEARERFGDLVNQFRYFWQLDEDLMGQVNRIVADEDRPLGEALALLPWRTFEDPGRDGPEEHLTRLAEWAAALEEYRGKLE